MQNNKASNFEFGKQVKQARLRAEMSQAELGALIAADQATISRVERGKSIKSKSIVHLQDFVDRQVIVESDIERILGKVASSNELRALIIRILSEKYA